MEHFKRHNLLWKIVYYPIRLLFFLWYGYHPKVQPIPAPSLIVSNHCTNLDPLMLALTVKNHTYFIASEHVFRKPLLAKFLFWAESPIVRVKGTTASDTALTAIRRLRKGYSVALFAEGNRTFNGVTADIVESTAKLARISGANLVTHRFRGAYFTSPRWSGGSVRRGRMTGEIVNIYTPDQLKAMTPAQIADVIRADIYEDAYATQAEWKIPYKGRNLARNLERVLCVCPRCEALGSMRTEGNKLFCADCGLTAEYTAYGYLEGDGVPFRTITEWDRWQADKILARAESAGEELIASDEDVTVCEVTEDHEEIPQTTGTLKAFRDRFECGDMILRFKDISGISINGPQTIMLSSQGRNLSILSDRVRNLRKYLTIYHAVTEPEKLLSI